MAFEARVHKNKDQDQDHDQDQDQDQGQDDELIIKINTGQWTDQEHSDFLYGLEEYGKNWKMVAATVKTRTVQQIRNHARQY